MLLITVLFGSLFSTLVWCLFLTTIAEVKERIETDPKGCLITLFFIWLGVFIVFAVFVLGKTGRWDSSWFGIAYSAFLITQAVTHLYLGWTSIKTFCSGLFEGGSAARRLARGVLFLEFLWYLMDYIWEIYFPERSSPDITKVEFNIKPLKLIVAMILGFFVLVSMRNFFLELGCRVKTALEQNARQVRFQIFVTWIVFVNIYLIYLIFEFDLWPEIRNASALGTCVAIAKHSLDSAMVLGWVFVTPMNEGVVDEVGSERWKNKMGVIAILSAIDVIFYAGIALNNKTNK